jgi:hypothetical protein
MRRALSVDREARPATARQLRHMLLAAYPEARTVDPAELAALLDHALGPPQRVPEYSGVTQHMELGSTVASTPTRTPADSEPIAPVAPRAGTQAGEPRRRRRGVLLAAALGVASLGALGLWSLQRTPPMSGQAAVPAAHTTEPSTPAVAKPAEAPVERSLAAPPVDRSHDLPTLDDSFEESPPEPNAVPHAHAGRRRARAEAARAAKVEAKTVSPEQDAPEQRTKEMHGVPIVEKPAF